MNRNKIKSIFVGLLLLIATSTLAQNEIRIEKKLDKKLKKGKIEIVEKKAQKLKHKYPDLEVSLYYLSKVELIKYNRTVKIPNKKQWTYLRKASGYASDLSAPYKFWQDTLKNVYEKYINSWNDNNYESEHLKKVVKAYSSFFNDTLLVYYNYYGPHLNNNSTTPPVLPVTDSLRAKLIALAANLVGIPYKYTGEVPETGFDCSGFVKYVYKGINVDLPHNAQLQSQIEGEIIPLEEAQPGDLIFFGSRKGNKWATQHAGIVYEYTEDEPKVIHCVSRGVSIDGNNTSWDSYWKKRILFVKRLPQLE